MDHGIPVQTPIIFNKSLSIYKPVKVVEDSTVSQSYLFGMISSSYLWVFKKYRPPTGKYIAMPFWD